ncbi:MAG: nucleoside deaminase [Deltaproteobacteria bacterium]|nr:nucleoside deaminase [Deltaproteobacteria bacterium]
MGEDHFKWITFCIELAKNAREQDEVPVGAILVNSDQIIGQGYNCRESVGRTVAHAEIMALEDYSRSSGKWRVDPGTSLYVTCEPCLMCTGALLWARVENIYFGCPDPKQAGIGRVLTMIKNGTFDHRFSTVSGGILKETCAALLSDYFLMKRKK